MMPLYYTYEALLSSTYILFGTLHISVLGDFCILDIFLCTCLFEVGCLQKYDKVYFFYFVTG